MKDPRTIDPETDPQSMERKAYETAIHCTECGCCYITDEDGIQKELPAPEWADVRDDMCDECRAIESEYDDDNQEPDYYYCTCCNHTQSKPGMGNGCDSCGLFNVMEEGYF